MRRATRGSTLAASPSSARALRPLLPSRPLQVHEPTLSLQIDEDGLQAVRVQEGGSLLAAGSVDGSVYLLELCESLSVQQPQEKQSMGQMLEREFKKEKLLENRQKELAKKAAKEGEGKTDPTALQPTDESLQAVEADFYAAVAQQEAAEADAKQAKD